VVANVLLDPLPNHGWKVKISDYGSVNIFTRLQTAGPGNPVYAAPEANTPGLQTPKMDIFSFGVLMVEILTHQYPDVDAHGLQRLIASIDHAGYLALIEQCLSEEKDNRPSAQQLLTILSDSYCIITMIGTAFMYY
jgi:serine/threonine protein kinase